MLQPKLYYTFLCIDLIDRKTVITLFLASLTAKELRMPNFYLHKHLYDEIVRRNEDPNEFANKVIAEAIYKSNERGDSSPSASPRKK